MRIYVITSTDNTLRLYIHNITPIYSQGRRIPTAPRVLCTNVAGLTPDNANKDC